MFLSNSYQLFKSKLLTYNRFEGKIPSSSIEIVLYSHTSKAFEAGGIMLSGFLSFLIIPDTMAQLKKLRDLRTKKKQQQDVLNAFEQYANISRACKKAKVPRRTFYNWLEEEDFRKQYEKSEAIAVGVLEDEATRRAIEGTLKPVFHKGKKIGSIREYSDTLTIVLLKARAPHKYKDRSQTDINIHKLGANMEEEYV
jgi:hypothetical protein